MLSIDVGYGNVKICDGESFNAFPAVYYQCKGSYIPDDDPNDLLLELDGVKYHVGQTAMANNGLSVMDRGDMLRHKLFVLTAICVVSKNDFEDEVLLGLPIQDYQSIANELKALKGEYDVVFNGKKKHIKITNVRVFMQGKAVYEVIKDENENLKEEQVGIIDVGQKTVDFAWFKFGSYVPDKSGSMVDLGCYSAYTDIVIVLNDKMGLDLKFYDAPHYAKRIPDESEEAYKRMAKDIVANLTNKGWGDFALLDRIYVIGGGANLVAKYLPRQDRIEVMDDPAFANAWGYFKGAEKK
ncbi:MAG: ParM/StbA family protein [Aeriscardovia sp.]|nr:ParM/StbA family protein [Aeriscardovia sp.]